MAIPYGVYGPIRPYILFLLFVVSVLADISLLVFTLRYKKRKNYATKSLQSQGPRNEASQKAP